MPPTIAAASPDAMPMPHMMLQLRRPAAQEQALATLIDQLHDPNSPNYHHWLTASEIGAQFGPAASDIADHHQLAHAARLHRQCGLSNSMAIDFSGTAGQVRTAFHTEIHNLVGQRRHPFRQREPIRKFRRRWRRLVVGVVSLNNIPPKPQMRATQPQLPGRLHLRPRFGNFLELVTPRRSRDDLQFQSAFNGGTTGQGPDHLSDRGHRSSTPTADWTTIHVRRSVSRWRTIPAPR